MPIRSWHARRPGASALLLRPLLRSIWLVVAVTFVMGTLGIFFENSASAILPMLVGREQLERANSWLFTSQTLTSQFVGMPLGGVLFAGSAALPFGIDAATFAGSCVLLLYVGCSFRAQDADRVRTRIRADVGEGLRWLWAHRLLRTLALLLAVFNGAFAAAEAVLVLYVLEVLHLPGVAYPLLLIALAIGAILGSFAASWLRARLGVGGIALGSVAVEVLVFAAIGLTSTVVACAAALVVGGFASMCWNVVTIPLRQAIVPARLLGRGEPAG